MEGTNLKCRCGEDIESDRTQVDFPSLNIYACRVEALGCPVCKIIYEINPEGTFVG